jgi:hypothetical protein
MKAKLLLPDTKSDSNIKKSIITGACALSGVGLIIGLGAATLESENLTNCSKLNYASKRSIYANKSHCVVSGGLEVKGQSMYNNPLVINYLETKEPSELQLSTMISVAQNGSIVHSYDRYIRYLVVNGLLDQIGKSINSLVEYNDVEGTSMGS